MTITTLVVGTADLRQALTAVRPHACTDREIPELARMRLTADSNHITITATDRFTAAMAVTSVWEHDGAPVDIVELLVEDIAKLLTIFKVPGKDAGDDGPQYLLRLEITDGEITVTDCSGFDIVGRRYRCPRLETADALDIVPALIERAHSGQIVLLDAVRNLTVSGDNLARFKVASSTYDQPLRIETRAGAVKSVACLLVGCGESFLGIMTPRRMLDEDLERAAEWAEGWSARLPGIVGAATGSRESGFDLATASGVFLAKREGSEQGGETADDQS